MRHAGKFFCAAADPAGQPLIRRIFASHVVINHRIASCQPEKEDCVPRSMLQITQVEYFSACS